MKKWNVFFEEDILDEEEEEEEREEEKEDILSRSQEGSQLRFSFQKSDPIPMFFF